jgi:predicted nucleic acid-binding protein
VHAHRLLVTTDYIVTEAVNLANARSGLHVAERILDLVDQSSGIRLEWIGSLRFEATKAFFRRHRDHRYSFTDCASFVLMKELKLLDGLTTDAHFGEAGFRVVELNA